MSMTLGKRCHWLRFLVLGSVVAGAASGLLAAWGTGPGTQQPPVAEANSEDTPQSAETSGVATSQPAAAEAAELAAREQMVSGLIGSRHDFTLDSESGHDLCLPCHAPHLVAAPLPRLDRQPTTTQPLQPYQGAGIELTGWSLLCLGCLDGVTAPSVYSSAHAVTVTDQLANSRLGTTELRGHPVGIKYPLAAEGYHPLVAVEAGGLVLPDGRIQCTTCHDAHNTHRHGSMLRLSNERSRVCLTCHRL
jgi:predicted CXXCH cytochrome family protein